MAHAAPSFPELKLHKKPGHGYARIGGEQRFFGKFRTTECRAKHEGAIAEWLARDRRPPSRDKPPTTSQAIAAFMAHAIGYTDRPQASPPEKPRTFGTPSNPFGGCTATSPPPISARTN